jgi:endonuclease/exonuclease/phosphatase family metal-dependent hydrolase
VEPRSAADALTAPFAVVSWNTHVGAGNIDALIADLRAGKLTNRPVDDFVLLVQEAYRAGDAVPSLDAVEWASAVLGAGPRHSRVEVVRAAERHALSSIYVPSMRNGRPGTTAEDRGNAILTTARLADVRAIELPLERQRRVALVATVMVKAGDGPATAVRVVSTHFTNMVMHHAWLLSESGRLRQARALAQALPADGPMILGGDLNSWFGYRDAAYRELVARLPSPAALDDRRATFGPMRLDHLLFRMPDGWRAELRRADSKYGSDHYPLVALIDAR